MARKSARMGSGQTCGAACVFLMTGQSNDTSTNVLDRYGIGRDFSNCHRSVPLVDQLHLLMKEKSWIVRVECVVVKEVITTPCTKEQFEPLDYTKEPRAPKWVTALFEKPDGEMR